MKGKLRILDFLVPLAVIGVFVLLEVAGLSQRIGARAYDILLRAGPASVAARDILLLDVDDRAVADAGGWSWSRNRVADGLVLLKELDAQYVLLDLPITQESASGIGPSVLHQTLPNAFEREFSRIEENIQSLFEAIRRGSIRPKDTPRYVSELIGLVAMGKSRLLDAVTGSERDEDARLEQAARFFGRTYVVLDLLSSPDAAIGKELEDAALLQLALTDATAARDSSLRPLGIRPPPLPLLQGAAGGGFNASAQDRDGVRRRAALTAVYRDRFIGQIAFAALLGRLGNPAIEIGTGGIMLRKARLPGMRARDIFIPLTENGKMLIDWPRASSGDGFRRLSWNALALHVRLEKELLAALRNMERSGYLSYRSSESSLLDLYDYASTIRDGMLSGGNEANMTEWRDSRQRFFGLADSLLNGDAEARIIGEVEKALSSGTLSEEEKKGVQKVRDGIPGAFADARRTYASLQSVRALLRENLPGSFCIVSLATSSAASSLGRSPLGEMATDGATSAALVNTILSGHFRREIPARNGMIFGAVLSILATLAIFRLRPLATALVGAGFLCAIAAGVALLFLFAGDFLNPLAPAGCAALTCAGLAVVKLLRVREGERAIRSRFAGRLSPGALKSLIAGMETPVTAGERRSVTVLTARVRGLPIDSESQDPGAVVQLLNAYHAGMCEVIFDLQGAIGRAEGDTISAYFGAPLDCADQVRRACLAAIRMKAADKELNRRLMADKLLSSPLATRLGIDAGDCVAGDLGMPGMAGYAVAGGAADLSARLARLNVRYGTSILVSDSVREAGRNDFIVRMLDRLRIPGSETPARFFELVAERDGADRKTLDAIDLFHEGLARSEENEWGKAEEIFRRVLALLPGDGPATAYIERCREVRSNPTREKGGGAFPLSNR